MLVLLVVISLALLTDYFGESSNSPLHSVQRGIATVLAPLQSGASVVLSPVRDVAGYISSTFNAKSQLAQYKSEAARYRTQLAQAQQAGIEGRKAAKLLGLDVNYGIKSYAPVTASVIGQDPSLWYRTIEVDKGSSSGVRYRDPVVGPGGLVGDVTTVNHGTSVVTLITGPNFSVGAEVQNKEGVSGLIQPKVGDPSTLTLGHLPTGSHVSAGQLVVTNGFQDPTPSERYVESWAPQGIPIGTVSGANPENDLLTNQQVQVTPLADLEHLSVVQILTRPHRGS